MDTQPNARTGVPAVLWHMRLPSPSESILSAVHQAKVHVFSDSELLSCVNRTPSQSACTDAHIVSAHHIAHIPCTTSVAQSNLDCVPKIVFVVCAVSHAMHSTLSNPSSTSPTITGLQRLITSRNPCTDPREPRGDGFTDPEPRTSYEPKRIVDNPTITDQEIVHSAEESQITEIEGLICQSLLFSTQGSIESIATP